MGWLDQGSATHGYLYCGGTYTTIEDPLAPNATFATGINDRGQIVGFYILNGTYRGFLDTNGVFTTLDYPGARDLCLRDQ